MQWRLFKYCSPFMLFALAWVSFNGNGWICFLPLIWTFVFIPLVELFIQPDERNLDEAEALIARADKRFDYLLYAVVVFQYASLIYFLFSLQTQQPSTITIIGRVISMGLLCGIFGINVAHELGHRANLFERYLSLLLLLSSQYLHFFIEHNKGHHKRVATMQDPASARLGENIFSFYPRTILFSYLSAWEIANKEVVKKQHSVWSIYNQMIQFTLVQLLFLLAIGYFFGIQLLGFYLIAAFIGIGLLEAVNYIEHYGLSRKEIAAGKFERAMPIHSWNSNHLVGRMMLFELSRHSDHHFMASRKYQILQHHDAAPQLPTGYPGMMILAHIPPLYFFIIQRQMRKYQIATAID